MDLPALVDSHPQNFLSGHLSLKIILQMLQTHVALSIQEDRATYSIAVADFFLPVIITRRGSKCVRGSHRPIVFAGIRI
jgi:hypothetical protein